MIYAFKKIFILHFFIAVYVKNVILHMKVKMFTIFVWGFNYYYIPVENRQTFKYLFPIKNLKRALIISSDSRQRGENSSGEIWEGETEERLQDSPRHEQPALGEKSGV